jgi:hypothetical protein
MSVPFLVAQTLPTTAGVDTLTKLTQLVAAHGVYALLVIFLFYQQHKTLKAYQSADDNRRRYLQRNHAIAVWTTCALLAVAVPVWIYATFVYSPKTVIWGNVANLTQMAGDPKSPGQVVIDQQVLPEQSDVRLYVDTEPKKGDPSKVTVYWALVEDGQYDQIPMVLNHHIKELKTAPVDLYPTKPSKLFVSDEVRKVKFVVHPGAWSAGQRSSFDYQYEAGAVDHGRSIGTMRLLRNGKAEQVKLEELSSLAPSAKHSGVWPGLSLLSPGVVFAQEQKAAPDPVKVNRALPLLGSRDLKLQRAAQETVGSAETISWDDVRKSLDDSKATGDRALFVRGLVEVTRTLRAKGVDVPADIRLRLAKEAYDVGDFKTAAELLNGLTDTELAADVTNYYYRGVSNVQIGNLDAAARDLAKYVAKAPTPAAKAAGRQTLNVVQKAQAKK